MSDDVVYLKDFSPGDNSIHELAVAKLMYGSKDQVLLTQAPYEYLVSGGSEGSLEYKKGLKGQWVLVANWSFYGAYMVVRYRHALWLRPMYETLFAFMNFTCVQFNDYALELTDTSGHMISGRRLRLSPPRALEAVLSQRFGYSEQRLQVLKSRFPSLFSD